MIDVGSRPREPAHSVRTGGTDSEARRSQHLTSWPGGTFRLLASSNVFIALVLVLLSWPASASGLSPQPGLDPSWQAALAMASRQGLPFGTHIVFTYGPLGFLFIQVAYYSSTVLLAFAFMIAFEVAVFVVLLRFLRKALALPLAIAAAYVVGGVAVGIDLAPEYSLALMLAGCIVALTAKKGQPRLLWAALGATLALFSLIKVSTGVGMVFMLLITLVCLPTGHRRSVIELATGFVITFVIGWFGTGNGFSNLVPFARSSIPIISGYASAMSLEVPSRWYNYWLAAVVVALVIAFVAVRCRGVPRRAATGIVLATLVVLWILFKEGFVRHDGHDLVFFVVAPVILAAVSPEIRADMRAGNAAVLGMATTVILALSVAGSVPMNVVQPLVSLRNFAHETSSLTSGSSRARIITQARASLQRSYAVPPAMLALMDGHTVDVDPYLQDVLWAYRHVRFDPLPVIQDYSAYTTSLDQLDANYVSSKAAPQYILQQLPQAIDNRDPAFEPPETQIALECRYVRVAANSVWELVRQVKDRCGRYRSLGTKIIDPGSWVTVPSVKPGDAVVATFNLSLPLSWHLENELFKPAPVYMEADKTSVVYRFVVGTSADPHLLRPASTLGYAAPFSPGAISRFRFEIGSGMKPMIGVSVSFYEMAMASGG